MTAPLRCFRDDFRQIAALAPDRPALIDAGHDGAALSYGALADIVAGIEALFEAKGVAAGGCVMTVLPHAAETLACFLAAMHGGYGFAPLTPEANARELRRWVGLVHPALCVVDDMLPAELRAVLDELGVKVLSIAVDFTFAWVPKSAPRPGNRGAARLFLTTSGSTGEPRALVFDGDRLWSSALAFLGQHGFVQDGDRFLNMLPMSYLGGLFNLCLIPLAARGTVVVWEAFTGRSFLNFWQTVERFEVSVLWLVPTIVRGLLAISERTKRHELAGKATPVRASFLGTAPIDLATKARFEEVFGIPLLENFALSETTFFSSETLNTRLRRREGSVGGLLPYADTRLVAIDPEAAEGVEAPTEIRVKSPFLFLGYLQEDGRLDLPLDEDGYFRTSDLGHMDGDLLVIDGRARDIIKKGGYFVSLREVEVLAEQNGAVAEAIALKIPHEFYGESYVLFLRLKDGTEEAPALAEFSPWLRANLVRYKWPERILAVADFPRTASGKVRKHLLAEKLA